jgi:hypothetical protein
MRQCNVRNRTRSLAIGIALAPLGGFGLVAVYTHGLVQLVCACLAVGLFLIAVFGIYLLERPRPRRTSRSTRGSTDLGSGVRWDREHPDAWFVQRDGGAALILQPHADDKDRRLVVLVWTPCTAVRVGPPNAQSGNEREWVGEVRPSSWVGDLDATTTDLRHFVVRTNAETIEVVAPDLVVRRVDKLHLTAAAAADDAQ